MKIFQQIMQQAAGAVIELRIYDDVRPDGVDWWTGETIPSETSANAISQILCENPDAAQINVYINSYGGDVKEGVAIYTQLKRHPANVTVYIDGFACSVAATIAMAGDRVVIGHNALMMIHHAWTTAVGNAAELRKAAEDIEHIDSAVCTAYLAKAGDKLTPERLTELLDAESWLNAEQCIAYGLADEIAGFPSAIDSAKQSYQQAKDSQFAAYKNAADKSFSQKLAGAIENIVKGD